MDKSLLYRFKCHPYIAYMKDNLNRLDGNRIYFDYGDKTLDVLCPSLQAKVDTMLPQNLSSDSWHSKFFPGDDHSELSWAKRLRYPLLFLFANKDKDIKELN
ncbi:hypothetical protein [Thalassotalea maritima]|uniref:hypothetical protein n=1 Tax=Thalassotalea maritima TaxID=3242416 RepID=UPI003526F573